jgi:hypothetical protein
MNGSMITMGMKGVVKAKMDNARFEAMLGNVFVVAYLLPFNDHEDHHIHST